MKESPEEKLLRLIKGEKNQKEEAAPENKIASNNNNSLISDFAKKIFLNNKILKQATLKPINGVLFTMLFLSVAYLIYSFIFETPKSTNNRLERAVQLSVKEKPKDKETQGLKIKNYEEYEKDMSNRNLFSAGSVEEFTPGESVNIDMSKKFNLVGVIEGDEPQAIIEDMEMQKTYYLYKGQSFNSAVVKEITKGKVVLNYRGREIILVM